MKLLVIYDSKDSARRNLARPLIELQRYDEARVSLLQAIECQKRFGHVVAPWLTWMILYNLEQACNNFHAATEARKKALYTYLEYRRAGGETQNNEGHLALAVRMAIQEGNTAEVEQALEELLEEQDWQAHKNFLHKLLAIIAGERDATLAEDEGLNYECAAEVILLLESLAE